MELPLHPDGWIGVVIPPGKRCFTALHVTAYVEGEGTADLYLEDIHGRKQMLSTSPQIVNRKYDLTSLLVPGEAHRVVYRVTGGPPGLWARIQNFSIVQVPEARTFPMIPTLLIGLAVMVLFITTSEAAHQKFFSPWLGALLTLSLLWLGTSGSSVFWGNPWLWLCALTLLLLARRLFFAARKDFKVSPNEFLLIPLALGLILRWDQLAGSVQVALDWSDAAAYREFALSLNPWHPFATSFREPMIIWVHYLAMKILGSAPIHIRLPTLLFSLGMIPATYLLTFKLSENRWAAWWAAFIISFNDILVYNATLGGRNDLFALLMLVFCLALLSLDGRKVRSEFLLGVLAGSLGLTWLIGLAGAGAVYLWRCVSFRLRPGPIALFYLTALAMISPSLIYQWKTQGDPLYSINFATPYYRSLKEGGAPLDQTMKSWPEYLEKKIAFRKAVVDTVEGYANLLLNPHERYNKLLLGFHYTRSTSYFLYPFLVLGLLAEIFRKRALGFILMFSFLNIMVVFMGNCPHPRIFLHAAPFFAYFCAVGICSAGRLLRRCWHPVHEAF